MQLLYEAKTRIIQRCWRRYGARKKYRNYMKKVVYLQSCVRRMIARRELKQLKVSQHEGRKVQVRKSFLAHPKKCPALIHVVFKVPSYGILSYFGHLQNYFEIDGDLKIVFYGDGKRSRR